MDRLRAAPRRLVGECFACSIVTAHITWTGDDRGLVYADLYNRRLIIGMCIPLAASLGKPCPKIEFVVVGDSSGGALFSRIQVR